MDAGSGKISWTTKVPAALLAQHEPGKTAPRQQQHAKAFEPVCPEIVSLTRGMVVILKPVNWEVDGQMSEGGGALPLSGFLQRCLSQADHALMYNADLDFGFIHRLDVPSSGLVLGGTSIEGLLALKWQISVYSIARQYLVVTQGHVPKASFEVMECIDATTVESVRSLTSDVGRPALTYLACLSHLHHEPAPRCNAGEADTSVLLIEIHTGRRHQIRAHTRHAGYPTVTDGKYAPREVMLTGGSC
eukprot:gnl/TRDRNA2_/TRDRNA2_175541_c3_seq3.p1 gnl/TRDRNA2_/TRDRNA2_175541_c3~~gnl/TRDRNA2_/TRDRNA2_175541_c3_seq3.p1  ORF type:complete len:246 (+),score=33.79 gnl/TRDRNA2_/TRDRNA2_175541_c3_seq3:172-909(+)